MKHYNSTHCWISLLLLVTTCAWLTVDAHVPLNGNGCISACPPRSNEHYETCPEKRGLSRTCRALKDHSLELLLDGDEECVPQCVCDEGYYRNSDGDCVERDECDTECTGDNEAYSDCKSRCPRTCGNRDKQFPCSRDCSQGCECLPNFVRSKEGKCIPPEQCPPPSPCRGRNKVYNLCPKECPVSEETCETYLNREDLKVCPKNDGNDTDCKPRCECELGYIRRTPEGRCITPDRCCHDRNAEMVECSNPCPGGTCLSPEFSLCRVACRRGCQCKRGHVKNADGKCVPLAKC